MRYLRTAHHIIAIAGALLWYTDAVAQDTGNVPAATAPAQAATTETQETKSPALPAIEYAAPTFKSLFFTPEEMKDIYYAVNIYRKNTRGRRGEGDDEFDEEDFLSRLTGMKQQPTESNRYYQYPQFYLESIVYHASDNWIVWVNGQKITQATPNQNQDLRVEEITADHVRLMWRPLNMDKVAEVWQKSPNNQVQVDMASGTVQFILRPNQTFSSYVMNILEGKVRPVTVDTHAVNLSTPLEETPPEAAGSESGQTNQGLGGLINAYKRIEQDQAQPPIPSAPTAVPAQPTPDSSAPPAQGITQP